MVLLYKPALTIYIAFVTPPVTLKVEVATLQVGCVILTDKVAGAGFTVTVIVALSLSIPFKVWLT